jgi:hypothetical protein
VTNWIDHERALAGLPVRAAEEKVLLGITGSFTAQHVCAELEPHPHDWHVEAQFIIAPRTDARCHRAAVHHLCAHYNGKQLPPELDWSEDIARAFHALANCHRVHVWRPEEDIHVYWPIEAWL